jgi:hypothetical protein
MTPPPAAAARTAAAPAVHPPRAPLAPARRPRRVSGPARPRARPTTTPGRKGNPAVTITTHPLFDRLINGRAWIGIVTFALIGIVTMQLGLLKLNAGIGHALEHEAALQRENSALSVENSEFAAGDTVELQATHMGMQLIQPGTLRFLSAQGSAREEAGAVAALSVPAGSVSATTETGASEAEGAAASTESSKSESTSATAPSTESEAAAESTAPSTGASSTAAETSEGSSGAGSTSAPAPTAAPTGESGGASASPQE